MSSECPNQSDCCLKPGEFKMSNDSLPAKKNPSITSDIYETLKGEVQQYVNIPEQEDYMNPTKESKSSPGPPPPPRTLESTNSLRSLDMNNLPRSVDVKPPPPPTWEDSQGRPPPPPSREDSQVSISRSDGVLFSKGSMTDLHKAGEAVGQAGPKTRVFKRDPYAGVPREPGMLRPKHSAFDSGVGDLEHIHVDCSQPKTYDYADYGHQYEELPNRKSIAKSPQDSGIDSRSEMYQSSSGTTDRSVSETGDTSNICNSHLSEKRKRVNPLYDAMTQSMPSIYNKTKSDQITETLKKQVRWLKCALIVFVVISCAALAVSIFAVINNIQTKDDRHPVLSPEVERLSASQERLELLLSSFEDNNDTMKVLSDLVQKVNRIQGNLTAELAGLNGRHVNQTMEIQKNVEQAMADFNNLTDVISHLNSTLQLQLHSISKMEGPQGPQGAANFSQCKYYNHTRSSVPSDSIPTYTPWFPTVTSLESNIALFAACSVEGGLYHSIQTHALSPQTVQYKCKCSGVSVPKVEQRHCIIHILECPRFS
ncbi:uncharacterized protein LOC128209653 isoform X2 [Mya arenaria]|uniref:uncharacterized protein LOC128209653 isoform X2 n=1 Tax=Mya arenaria TaxID=6604 RepID=UPI0022E4FB05|nr:uncharacterized protein LOC128209653 isoform X2 [Mya arenaria]